MKILITGAGGFIGSHVVELLARNGYQIRALVRYNGRDDWGHLRRLPADILSTIDVRMGDVTDPFMTRALVDGCDTVLHLAALIGIPYSYVAPASYVTANIHGTLNILEACRQQKIRRLVVTSTSEVYGTALYTPIDENHPLQGQSPYSASKIAADKFAESYFRSFDLPVVILRPFNTYGPRQSARAVIPTILMQALKGATVIQLGNLAPKRDLTFVTDTAQAFLLAATVERIEGETIHFGQGVASSVAEIADLCLSAAGSRAKIDSVEARLRPPKSEVDLLLCGAAKAEKLLGWRPSISLEDGIKLTADYIKRHIDDYRSGRYAL